MKITVTDLTEYNGIVCSTLEEADQICKLMHKAWLTWNSGKSYLYKNPRNFLNEELIYYPAGWYCLSKKRARIFPASDFLEEFTEGELVEVSENYNFSGSLYWIHLTTIKWASKPYIISWKEEIEKRDRWEEFYCSMYKYVRKLSPPKEMTVKQIEDKLWYKVTII